MIPSYSIFSIGDQAVSLELDSDVVDSSIHELVLLIKNSVEEHPFDGLLDIVPGYRSVSVIFDLYQLISSGITGRAADFVSDKLKAAYESAITKHGKYITREIRIPVCYDEKFGLDLDYVSRHNKITREEIVQLHIGQSYKVYLVGFLPGFPYMGFVDKSLEVPRRDIPRTIVHAGSVGLAGRQTGIYPFDSPGGWQIIGRTPLTLFNPLKYPPVLIESGDMVSFYKIEEDEFSYIQHSQT
jgi:inhibitor of KinA